MADCKPMDPKEKLVKVTENEMTNPVEFPYQQLIGTLLYLSVWTQPDIAHVTNVLRQYSSCYKQRHWAQVKRRLRYLKDTIGYSIIYKKRYFEFTGYADANCAEDQMDRRSYTRLYV